LNRIFSSILMLTLALAAIIPATAPAIADSGDKGNPAASFPAALAIKVPNRVELGQSVNISVFGKRGHDQISGASVYLIKADDLVIKPGSENYTTLISEYATLVESKGTLIGVTGDNGTLAYQFTETGRFVLAATADNFIPGFSRLTVTSAAKKALAIQSPSSAALNETVTFTVTEQESGQAVAGSQLYAWRFDGNGFAEGLAKKSLPFGNKSNDSDNWSISIPGIKESGILLGSSDDQGQVSYAFSTAGRYFLMAVSDNYSAGYSMLSVALSDQDTKPDRSTQQLTIAVPQSSAAGQQVTITVSDNTTPVQGASVYILTPKGAEVKKFTPTVSNSQNNHNDAFGGKGNRMGILESSRNVPQNNRIQKEAERSIQCVDNSTIALGSWSNREDNGRGTLAGNTDSNGQVVYTFISAGQYEIAVYKDGYKPGSAKIQITQ
jgi:hypothetical protein